MSRVFTKHLNNDTFYVIFLDEKISIYEENFEKDEYV